MSTEKRIAQGWILKSEIGHPRQYDDHDQETRVQTHKRFIVLHESWRNRLNSRHIYHSKISVFQLVHPAKTFTRYFWSKFTFPRAPVLEYLGISDYSPLNGGVDTDSSKTSPLVDEASNLNGPIDLEISRRMKGISVLSNQTYSSNLRTAYDRDQRRKFDLDSSKIGRDIIIMNYILHTWSPLESLPSRSCSEVRPAPR